MVYDFILFSIEAGSERRIGDFDGELIGVELFSDPFDLFGTFRMSGVGQDLEQVLIAPRASAIFWRTAARTGNAGRIGFTLKGRLGFLDCDHVFPVVAEVVSIGEAGNPGFYQAILMPDRFRPMSDGHPMGCIEAAH